MVSEAVFIGGRSGAGKTSVGYEIHAQLSAAAVTHCLVDGDSLDMAFPAPWQHDLAERNLAAIWSNYRALGYRRMVYINTVSVLPDVMRKLTLALGDRPRVLPIMLTCSDDTARERLARREIGSTLDQHIAASSDMCVELEAAAAIGTCRIATDGRTVPDIALDVIAAMGWLA